MKENISCSRYETKKVKLNNKLKIPLTASICHAVKEKPRVGVRAVFDKGHIVAGLNTENSKQLHHVPGNRCISGYVCWYCESFGGVTLP